MNDLYSDKVALVTGASSGIGWGIARELARQGASVVLVARRKEKLEQLAREIAAEGGQAWPLACDITVELSVKEMARQVKGQFGRLDLLVNNAGQELTAPLLVTTADAARRVLDVNVVAAVMVTKACLGLLARGSAVVNISSASALRGAAGMAVYSASKGAVISLTRSLGVELAPRGVRVNCVAPGMVQTDLLKRLFKTFKPEQVAAIEAQHPLGFGTVEDVAAAVAFLGSDKAKWITGQVLVVDGGLTA